MIEPTSTSPGTQLISIREWEAWQRAQANEAVLRQTMLEEARDALEKLVNSRFDAAQTALNAALAAHQELHAVSADTLLRERAMVRDYLARLREADQIAISKAEQAVDKRLEGMNELRAQITSERGEYVRIDTYSARHDELITRLNALEQGQVAVRSELTTLAALPARVNTLENGAANIAGRMTVVAAVITVILTFVVVAVNLVTSRL